MIIIIIIKINSYIKKKEAAKGKENPQDSASDTKEGTKGVNGKERGFYVQTRESSLEEFTRN